MRNALKFVPTAEQAKIIGHGGSAFVEACPGAGKTKVMVERARQVVASTATVFGRGLAFLSFTRAAVSELESRLYSEGVIGKPTFPHFVGTFDSFVWQFFIAPFGVPGVAQSPHLLPDKDKLDIAPNNGMRGIPLGCFDRETGVAIKAKIERIGFTGGLLNYETTARIVRERFLDRAVLDFDDARHLALQRLRDKKSGVALRRALQARFVEIIVDEAQDCNPADLEIVAWLRDAGVPIKVICDPNQSIYSFRGGVGDELKAFAATFPDEDRLPLAGNFRSGSNIAKVIVALREPSARGRPDEALGKHRDEPTPVHLLAYAGHSAPVAVGCKFEALTASLSLNHTQCPIIGSTLNAARAASGQPKEEPDGGLSYRLAVCVDTYHRAVDTRLKGDALEGFHRIALELSGALDNATYHQHLIEAEIEPNQWRPSAIATLEALRFQPDKHTTVERWLIDARDVLRHLLPAGSASIARKLQNKKELATAFSLGSVSKHPAHTIHAVKGKEFDAVCVVLAPKTAKKIVDCLIEGGTSEDLESARKIYVGASRARRLLVIAVPKSQAKRLHTHLLGTGALVALSDV
ncbi:ATP-dependent helicase [Xanthomonas euvesicatoria]|uniref:UvrD-helicase domain-containing protein n=1 Tax=Xanthomonas citri TaxID=346 RepID=UPI000F815864|nr:ATP-dependent helicase [Xanthomonas axonopodis]MEE5091144.1 ATP-dependent helicase [Xanthomonas euvesicatoria]RTE55883.1 ATP-dependent helicase [Xanthomonas axonopodis pv. eucalyptorum]